MTIPPPPLRDKDRGSPIWLKWDKDVANQINVDTDGKADKPDSPTADNFASLDATGNLQDSGYDDTSFAGSTHTQAISTITGYNEVVIALLGSATVHLQNGDAKSTAYTVPAGKTAVITHVVIRNPTASLLNGTDFDIGSGVNADTWRQTVSLTTMTAATDYMVIPSVSATPVKYTLEAAGAAFGIKPITGATADADATMDVFGYLF